MRSPIQSLAILVMLLVLSPVPAAADPQKDCTQDSDWWLRLSACTAAIESGRWVGSRASWAYSNRAVAHAALGNYLEAFDDHERAVKLNPSDAQARNNKGNSHADFREYDRALEEYGMAIRLRPGFLSAYFNRASVLVALSRYDEAVADYDRVIAARPDLGSAYLGRAEAQCQLGNVDASVADRLEAIRKAALTVERTAIYLQSRGYGLPPEVEPSLTTAEGPLRAWTQAGCP